MRIMAECKNYERNTRECDCSSDTCDRRGYCCECLAYHRERGQVPACLKDLVAKAT